MLASAIPGRYVAKVLFISHCLFASLTIHSFIHCFFRVPLGFVCGYPLAGGELYGGSMFARSAASDTRQGQAMQRVNSRWGSDALDRAGRESLGIPVCKKKYTPFVFPLTYKDDGSTAVQVHVERRFGCRAHHALRQEVIRQHGCRPGWEPFGQWSMHKALQLARKETVRRNKKMAAEADAVTTTEDEVSLDDDTNNSNEAANIVCCLPTHAQNNFRSLCWNGNCLVKHPSMYDDVEEEVRAMPAVATTAASGEDAEPADDAVASPARKRAKQQR